MSDGQPFQKFEVSIETLENDLFAHANKSLLLAAKFLMMTVTRDLLPDWVEILANGDLEKWEAAVDLAREDIAGESLAVEWNPLYGRPSPQPSLTSPRPSPKGEGAQKGQAGNEFAIGLFILALLALAAWSAVGPLFSQGFAMLVSQVDIAMDMSHGAERHGSAATLADQCFQQHGVYETWWNESTRRAAQICHVPDSGDWFIQVIQKINGKWEEITKFQKNKMSSYEQVAQYLRNCGYVPGQ